MYVHSYWKYTQTRNKIKKTMAFKMLITADYHQGNESIFFYLSRGRQCVANSVVFVIKAHYESFIIGVNMNCTMFYMEVIY